MACAGDSPKCLCAKDDLVEVFESFARLRIQPVAQGAVG